MSSKALDTLMEINKQRTLERDVRLNRASHEEIAKLVLAEGIGVAFDRFEVLLADSQKAMLKEFQRLGSKIGTMVEIVGETNDGIRGLIKSEASDQRAEANASITSVLESVSALVPILKAIVKKVNEPQNLPATHVDAPDLTVIMQRLDDLCAKMDEPMTAELPSEPLRAKPAYYDIDRHPNGLLRRVTPVYDA